MCVAPLGGADGHLARRRPRDGHSPPRTRERGAPSLGEYPRSRFSAVVQARRRSPARRSEIEREAVVATLSFHVLPVEDLHGMAGQAEASRQSETRLRGRSCLGRRFSTATVPKQIERVQSLRMAFAWQLHQVRKADGELQPQK